MGQLKFAGQISLFDVTVPVDKFADYRSLAEKLGTVAKKWVFQKEKGDETDYIHWQVRLSLHKKASCAAVLRDCVPVIPGHWSVTSSATHDAGNVFNYVMKAQTRMEGPWTDQDADLRPPPVLTRQLIHYHKQEKYPWQVKMEAICRESNDRRLYYIFDPHYNSGKSIFCEDMEYKMLAEEIPPFTLMEDIMQFVFCQHKSPCYLFDMPAAMKKEKVHQLYSGLEMLKNGFLYDKRYNGKKLRISRPIVAVFANNLPQLGLMAPDRWVTMYITPKKNLVEFDALTHPYAPDEEEPEP